MNRFLVPVSELVSESPAPPVATEVSGWRTSDSSVFAQLIAETRPTRIIEVGTWLGMSAITMLQAAAGAGVHPQLICVDTWLGSQEFWDGMADRTDHDLRLRAGYPRVYDQFLANVRATSFSAQIVPCPMPSRQAARLFSAQSITAELIYLDGSHEEEDVLDDCQHYWPLVREGGILFGDDYLPHQWPGVVSAVRTMWPDDAEVEILDPFWIVRKS